MRIMMIAVLATSALLAGCTGSGDGDDAPIQDDQGRYVVTMSGVRFTPDALQIPVGSTVVWINEGGAHNVAPDGHGQWQATTVTGEIGEHLEVTFDQEGTFDYFCTPHRSVGMTGSITVVAA